MKTLMAAALLLVFTCSAYATEDPPEDRKSLSWQCQWTDDERACIQQGMQDYRAGQCFRARPYADDTEEGKLWLKGWNAHQTKKQGKRNDEHCYGTRG